MVRGTQGVVRAWSGVVRALSGRGYGGVMVWLGMHSVVGVVTDILRCQDEKKMRNSCSRTECGHLIREGSILESGHFLTVQIRVWSPTREVMD